MTIWLPEIETTADDRPIYERIARSLERDVRSGRLAAGERLPTHRALAERLGVNVGTVSRAYAAALRAGWIRGEIGRGTFVREVEASDPARLDIGASSEVDLSVNVPVDVGVPDLGAGLRALSRRSDLGTLMHYQPSEGRVIDRCAGVEALRRHGVETNAERIAVCAGAQHGLSVALDAVAKSGEWVAAAKLSSPGFRPLAEQRGLRIHPIELDPDGIVPECVEEVCRRDPIRALYVVPTFQNPTGANLAHKRREQLASLAERYNFVVIEDDIHRLLAVGAPPPVASFAPDHTFYIASLSKSLASGLRIAYVSPPAHLRERLVDGIWRSLWTVSPLTAALATQWISDGTLDRVVSRKRDEAAARQKLARAILHLSPSRTDLTAYHLWLELAEQDALQVTAAAAARGVRVTPAHAFVVGRTQPPAAVRISLSAARDRTHLRRGLEILASVLADGAARVSVRV